VIDQPRTRAARRAAEDALTVEVRFACLAGYLLAKAAAAAERRKPKDWYDIAFVLPHNDLGGPQAAARQALEYYGDELQGAMSTALDELRANFADASAQGPRAYVAQMSLDHPDLDASMLGADAVIAVEAFCTALLPATGGQTAQES
jgi:hypothetical protein